MFLLISLNTKISNSLVKRNSTQFERLNVAYNIAGLYSEVAYQQPLDDTNGIKRAYNYFQKAAGAFKFILDELLPHMDQPPPLDLDAATIETLQYICLAQAQETFWVKAKLDNLKNILVSRLAMQVSNLYAQALDHASRSTAIRTEWIHHLMCKRYHFEAAAHYRVSLDCLDKGKYGEEIGHLRIAMDVSKTALANSKYVAPSVISDATELNNRVKTDLAGAEKDNDLIYLQTIPTPASLPAITAVSMVKSEIPEVFLDPVLFLQSSNSKPLFKDILPYTIYEANNAYNEKINEYVQRNLISKIEELTVNMHASLQQLNLPGSLEAVEKPMGVPQSLLLHSDEIRTKGGVNLLRGTINDIQKLYRESVHLLDEGKQILVYEENEDTMMRNRQGTDRWTRAPSKQAGSDLWASLSNFDNYLKSSESSDRMVRDKFHKIERYLEIMCEGRQKLEAYIPNSTVVNVDSYLEYSIQELREALLKTRGIEYQRQKYINNLMYKVANIETLPEIITEYQKNVKGKHGHVDVSQFESVYKKHVAALQGEYTGWLDQQAKEQEQLLTKITELNRQFLEIRDNEEASIERENAIQNLEVAYFKFAEIVQNLDEGRKFYNSLMEQLVLFVDQCKEFVYQRRIEGRELESSISDSFSQLSMNSGGGLSAIASPVPVSTPDNHNSDENEEPLVAPQARHPAMISRVWHPGNDLSFGRHTSTSPSSGRIDGEEERANNSGGRGHSGVSGNINNRTWKPSDGINFG